MRAAFISIAAAMALTSGACAQQTETTETSDVDAAPVTAAQNEAGSEGQRLARLAFKSVDTGGKGYLHTGDVESYREGVFLSMDADESASIEVAEFISWDFGFINEANELGKRAEYDTALKTVFTIWDRDGDGSVTEAEHRFALRADFDRMDINGNSILEEDEFLRGFSVMAAIRAALKQD